ncbi:MAG: hypothetical protein WCI67_14155 [Chloroflexales bacterium]
MVTYDDGHFTYIQAKEMIRSGESAWSTLWHDFTAQYLHSNFQRGKDRLVLHIGHHHNEHDALDELCRRAQESDHYAEWWQRLTQSQQGLVERIKPNLSPELHSDDQLLSFFVHVAVEIWPLVSIERDLVPYWMPPSSVSADTLYRLLHNYIGEKAGVRGSFTEKVLRSFLEREQIHLEVLPNVRMLREAVQGCGALLRAYRSTIGTTGQHIQRAIVAEIVNWTRTVTGNTRVAMLLDQAGIGKTVVMRDVLASLDKLGIATLAVKADQQLSGVAALNELPARLNLPGPVDRVVARLAALEPVVVLIDQIDALSLSLAHDQHALDTILDLVARLSHIPGVVVILSCRIFDRNSDPRLKRLAIHTGFHINELSDEEVSDVLQPNRVDFASLAPPLKKLLRVPLHLDLFMRALEGRDQAQPPSIWGGITSVQDLYDLLWRHVILKQAPGCPPATDREAAIRLVAAQMNRDQRTAVPETIFMTPDTKHLEQAVNWLASAGILIQGNAEWSFLHQTFFDYCYAKQFVERGDSLVQTVLSLSGDQGLFSRSHIVQVLSYLRGRNNTRYLQEFWQLLTPASGLPSLRIHLRDLLFRWFGSLPNHTDAEWSVALRMLIQPSMRPHLLGAIQTNPGWFARLHEQLLQSLLNYDDHVLDTEIVPYLVSMVNVAQGQIVSLISPYLRRSDKWNDRVAHIVSGIRTWHAREAADLFEQLCQEFPGFHFNHLYDLHVLVTPYPQTVCRLVRLAFDRKLASHIQPQSAPTKRHLWMLSSDLEELNSGSLVEILKALSERWSGDFVDAMLPWLEHVLRLSGEAAPDSLHYVQDELAFSWHDHTYAVLATLRQCLVQALTKLARTEPETFRLLAQRLAALPYETPQLLLANTYQAVADLYTKDALDFLWADQRRLDLGDQLYDSRQLIAVLYSYLSLPQRQELESYILGYVPIWRQLGLRALQRRGLEQLFLLQSIPPDLLSLRARFALSLWERKFPGIKAVNEPRIVRGGWVESPITIEAAKKMADRAWLRAMRKYQPGISHHEPLKGGPSELSGVLGEVVKENPERFYRLFERLPYTPAEPYVAALLNGLAESTAPAEWVFAAVRRFAAPPSEELALTIGRVLQRRVGGGVPDDLIALLDGYVRTLTREFVGVDNNPYLRYLNSTHGAAFNTLMRILDQRASAEATAYKWALIEYAATAPSSALRAGAIEELLDIRHLDVARAVRLFIQLMEGYPDLLRSHYTHDFVYYSMYQHFSLMQPFIRGLMASDDEQVRQQGAILACIAAMSPKILELEENRLLAQEMADEALEGHPAWRRGAAIVYTRYILSPGVSAICLHGLRTLLDDEDGGVQSYIGGVFHSFSAEHIVSMRSFIEAYAAAPAFYKGSHQFLEYLAEYALLDPPWTLTVVDSIAQNTHQSEESRWFHGGADLVRVVLRIYTDPTADTRLRTQAMNAFDRLMDRYSGPSQTILGEWDAK